MAAATGGDVRDLDDLRRELLRHQIASKWDIIDCIDRALLRTVTTRSCPLCRYEGDSESFVEFETQCIFGGGTLLRHQCPECDVIFGPDKMLRLSDAELSQDYEWHYRAYEEGDSTDLELRAFHAMRPSRGGAYLNYGAGAWSRSVELLRNDGWEVYAFEPHSSASDKAGYAISSREALKRMRFDGVYSNNVLEHLREPVSELRFMRSLLKSRGRLSHATPCFEYLYEFTRFHLFFFLGRSRSLLAREACLDIEEFTVDGEFMNCVMFPSTPL